ncbi:hypothetical protein DM2_3285 [Halorubrum sp. DM2]|nr:hypothetical protein DM2_3285 [Halorubrum sp. DM2]
MSDPLPAFADAVDPVAVPGSVHPGGPSGRPVAVGGFFVSRGEPTDDESPPHRRRRDPAARGAGRHRRRAGLGPVVRRFGRSTRFGRCRRLARSCRF